jgi:uncharacterized protein (DUF934 family)
MPTLIKNRNIAHDSWQQLERTSHGALPDIPSDGDIIVPLPLWRANREELDAHRGRVGVWLEPSEGPEAIAEDLERLPLVAVHFPKITDGRGYSTARLLRERYGYRGELRAIGDIQRDQLLFLARCGFDAFAVKDGRDAQAALEAFSDFSEAYQGGVDQPWPLFRRRAPKPASESPIS